MTPLAPGASHRIAKDVATTRHREFECERVRPPGVCQGLGTLLQNYRRPSPELPLLVSRNNGKGTPARRSGGVVSPLPAPQCLVGHFQARPVPGLHAHGRAPTPGLHLSGVQRHTHPQVERYTRGPGLPIGGTPALAPHRRGADRLARQERRTVPTGTRTRSRSASRRSPRSS